MKHITITMSIFLLLAATSCEKFLDREIETSYNEDEVFVNYERMSQAGYGVYTFLFNRFGFHRINNAMLASASDEADHANTTSTIIQYNWCTWNETAHPTVSSVYY